MDTVMLYANEYFFDSLYTSIASITSTTPLPRDNVIRFYYDKDYMKHPRFLKNQHILEIKTAFKAFPIITILTIPWIYAEINGKTRLYDDPYERGVPYLFLSAGLFLLFTDFCIYWVHRLLHHPLQKVETYLSSVPYHLATIVIPLYKWLYLGLFAFVNVWSVMIHDGNYLSRNPVVNGSAHHSIHHTAFLYNYGQFFTFFDRIFGSFREPGDEIYDPKLRKSNATIKKVVEEVNFMEAKIDEDDKKIN
ncbi:hypothetical protein BB560_000725 [Smittium megazygosporum]|uniref:Fatty acid hydroxylase domain-containing protein n=1 Tax=Smittium megazygosporum TaxID=133381 RepID=A0A2T9ZJJ8_9FUNG|nr:hypothetical protein BB560_000725 [Smittium megazygosporum]